MLFSHQPCATRVATPVSSSCATLTSPLQRTACRPRLAAPASSAASEGASRSFDEEDTRTRLEFDGVVGSVRGMHKAAAHLDLMWRLQARKLQHAQPCSCCHGSGEKECDWCHGTGFLTLGDSLVCSTAEHSSSCPVCKAKGYTPCAHCCGTGFRAAWLGDGGLPGNP